MPEPVHEGNLDNDAREARIRAQNLSSPRGHDVPVCQCSWCFILRRLDDARAQHQQTRDAFDLTIRTAIDLATARRKTDEEPNLSAPVRSAPASRARVDGNTVSATDEAYERACPRCGSPRGAWCKWIGGDGALSSTVHAERAKPEPVRVEVRPVIDATPRTPPLGHWWTANIGSVSEVNDGGRELVVSARCVVCGERPEAHE